MHKRLLFLVFGLAIALASCQKEVFDLSEDVSIGYNSSIHVQTSSGQLTIKYTELLDESRCPPGAFCVSEGFVKVKLKLNDQQHVELGLGETTVDSVAYDNHIIKLLAVEYDSDDDFGEENKSSVVVRVD